MRVLSDHDRRDAAALAGRAAAGIEIGIVVRRASSVRGSGAVLLACLVVELGGGAGGAAVLGACANSDWPARWHRHRLPCQRIASRLAIVSRGSAELLASPCAFAVLL